MIGEKGLDNMMWFVGLVEDTNDNLGNGRVRVRCYGIHPPYEDGLVETQDLPWAHCIRDAKFTSMPDVGDTVIGFFTDGRDAQQPMVLGIITSANYAMPSGSNAQNELRAENNGEVVPNQSAAGDDQAVVEIMEVGKGYNIVRLADGSIVRREGTRAWRNNNPGNIEYGSFAKSQGAIGSDGRFAIFPNFASGTEAQKSLITGGSYKGKTIAGMVNRYAPPSENNSSSYAARIASAAGVGVNTPMSALSESQLSSLISEMHRVEGYKVGKTTNINGGGKPVGVNPYLKPTQDVYNNYGNPPLPHQMSGEGVERSQHLIQVAARQSVQYGANNQYGIDEPDKPYSGDVSASVWQTKFGGSNIELAGKSEGREYISISHESGSHIILDGNGNITIKSFGRTYNGTHGDSQEIVEGVKMAAYTGGLAMYISGGTCEIESAGDVTISSGGNLNLNAGGRIAINAGDTIEIGGSAINITAQNDELNFLAASNINLQAYGGTLGLKSDGTLTLDSAGAVNTKAGGNVNLGGAEIHLNTSAPAGAPGAVAANLEKPIKKGVTTPSAPRPTPSDISSAQSDEGISV